MTKTLKDAINPDQSLDSAERDAANPGGYDADSTAHIERLGPSLVNALFSASRTIQVHDFGNRATQKVIVRLMEVLDELIAIEGRVTLKVSTDLLLINDIRLVVNPQGMGPFLYITEEMKKRKVEEIAFASNLTAEEVGKFVKEFFTEITGEDVFGQLSQCISEAGITNISVTEWIERVQYLRESRIEKQEIREESNKLYSRAALFMGEALRAVEQRRPIQMPKAQRLTQQLTDVIQFDETTLVGLASIKDYDEYTFAHSVNVCVLSMLIADRLGLSKHEISRIGVAALLHDLGKILIPQGILNKPDALTDGEWELMKRHPMLGVGVLCRARALKPMAESLFVTLQHHVQYNNQGYPQKEANWDLLPASRIVTIADYFDAMTTPRVYRKNALRPDHALLFILQKSGEIFDPLIAKVFVRAMGTYPVGTVVELDTDERAVVLRQNDETHLMHRPFVSLLGGGSTSPEDAIDLSERADGKQRYKRTIVRSVHDESTNAQKASYFVVK